MNSQTGHVLTANIEGAMRNLDPLVAVSENKRSGLILCKTYHAEFAGPGAVVGPLFDTDCTEIIAIGAPEMVELVSYEERQQAYGRRIQWERWLEKITDNVDPLQRTEKLFAGFEAFFGSSIFNSLPDDILALLVGVLPTTIATVRAQYRHSNQSDDFDDGPLCKCLSPTVIRRKLHSKYALDGQSNRMSVSSPFTEPRYNLPCLA